MSLAALGWAWQEPELDPTEKLVLLALADAHNGETGLCCPSRQTLMEKACTSESSVKRWLRSLERRGLIHRVATFGEDGRQRTNEFRLAFDFQIQINLDPRGAAGDPGEGAAGEQGPGATGGPPLKGTGSNQPEEVTTEHARARWQVDRKPVTPAEDELARQLLAAWNAQTGQTLTAREWLAKFVMRIREHPELELAHHEAVIERALADPWWRGPASPSVVYGTGAQFEKALVAVNESSDLRERFAAILAKSKRVAA